MSTGMKMRRREFLGAALTAGGLMWTQNAEAQQAPIPPTPKSGWRSRPAKVQLLFAAPGRSGQRDAVYRRGDLDDRRRWFSH